MTLDAVVFDFDGLIIDSEWVIFGTALAAFEVHGHTLPVEAWATVVGLNDDAEQGWWEGVLDAAGVADFDQAEFEAAYAAQDRSNRDVLPLLPGVGSLVADLRAAGVPLGIASSSSVAWLHRHTERLGVGPYFATMVGSDLVGGIGKPAPDVYLRACSDLEADPARSVALEDSAHGVTATKAAGMSAVAVPSRITRHNDFGHADLMVGSLTELSVAQLDDLVARGGRTASPAHR